VLLPLRGPLLNRKRRLDREQGILVPELRPERVTRRQQSRELDHFPLVRHRISRLLRKQAARKILLTPARVVADDAIRDEVFGPVYLNVKTSSSPSGTILTTLSVVKLEILCCGAECLRVLSIPDGKVTVVA